MFCPVSNKEFQEKYNKKRGKLELDLYTKLLNDLKSIDYCGTILYSGFSEPLLHPEINNMIKTTREILPACRIEMITNGDLLTPEKLKLVFDASLDEMKISLYDGAGQIEHFNSIINPTGLKDKVVLRRRYYQDGNYGLTISNRGGLVDSNKFRDEHESEPELPLNKACYYPFYMLKMDFDGAIYLCSHEWKKSFVLGNIKENSIWEIWTGENINFVRRNLMNADRKFDPCSVCDVYGDLIGKESYEAWLKILKG